MRTLPIEKEIVKALQLLHSGGKITIKNLMEWSTSPLTAQEGEKLAHFEELGVYVAYKEKL